MAKNTIFKKIKLWFQFKYYRWFKKEIPYIYHCYTSKRKKFRKSVKVGPYEYIPITKYKQMATYEKLLLDTNEQNK